MVESVASEHGLRQGSRTSIEMTIRGPLGPRMDISIGFLGPPTAWTRENSQVTQSRTLRT
jgi:hypothetical protein